ncbi:MafB [Neisseria lactamica]|uniref:MafB n=1 Tax=Neisseria lactamica TaxID=486 RepID=UPI000BB67665|nr:MafB [Neisseria lactamica]
MYWDDKTGIIVIQDNNSNDRGAVFRPASGEQYTAIQIVGGDNIVRHKLYIPGSYQGKDGNFEYIREADGKINHRLFAPNWQLPEK